MFVPRRSPDDVAYYTASTADPTTDMVGYVQVPLWLSKQEVASLAEQVREMLLSKMDNAPESERQLYVLSPIFFPIDQN
ncbi:hypothetical protein [Phytohabitans aurantiacus]|uniref:Uncharacterized protein n=1 Tax=Phytohabitans aurantiacus TaxID=3016789 RepID=A0ABQ5QXB1_9ACTN|nr:hypothetical protein [Phytohabitans aurantiacus]GLH98562.1 hypothetical protein Pa4123_38370 [Phytohabitans aurantiacus]